MTYWGLNGAFLAVVVIVGVTALVVARRRARAGRQVGRANGRADAWVAGAIGMTLGIVLILTAIFDNVMIAIGLVGYDEGKISGAFVGIAPLEDFAYALAAVFLLPSLWVLLGARGGRGARPSTGGRS
ncbi:MAG: lycopene cyclase domain-containing protein [Herbiconiux sp.]|uniref:lycopene cyclase domain-containing protein n=1 Tax=Herbiconiux sp. TaxID=1871186 RepID=UPI00122755F3|nr:lycopene cyclase domain-containing protein [Herbiconiux sp.]TAJ48403.1 MAG: lycopene cyclase domain-containing protein [Herbiconiux sp.]